MGLFKHGKYGQRMSHERQVKPDAILHIVTEAEEQVWSRRGITEVTDQQPHGAGDLGHVILGHGSSTKKLHSYFANLEQQKCCLLLTACKQTFNSVRLVRNDGRDSGIEEGAMMKSAIGATDMVMCLDEKEFRVFQHALRCAAFPVLGAPEPPSGSSPSPSNTPVGRMQHKRSVTPHSLTDSGVEEQEDTAMVPAETLCELLRRSFRLSVEKFNQYEEMVASQMEKKSPQKVLAEELVRQLMALENNNNPFYNPSTFLNRLGYDQWQQKERAHIADLLNKFWHFALPQITNRAILVKVLHEQYRTLMERLIGYESPYRQQSELISPPPTAPLSSASVRLLKEFGLRYGVGDQFRKIIYLNYLALNFDPRVWFIQHVIGSLTAVMDAMPSKRSCLCIVKEEHDILKSCLHLLEAKAAMALTKMQTLFPNQQLEGIEVLIELLSVTIHAKCYLLMTPEPPFSTRLFDIVQKMFPESYERHKMVAQDELRHNKWGAELNSKLLYMMMGQIRDEVQEFKHKYQHAFQKYFNITVEAAQTFYSLLMVDVAELHKQSLGHMSTMEINLLMLSLGYRLNQLDHDWSTYITPQMQTWREHFLVQAQHWSVVMKVHMQDFITQSVAADRYSVCELHWSGSLHQSSSQQSHRHRTISSSLTPSTNSAFSSLSSVQSTPILVPGVFQPQQTIPESKKEHSSLSGKPSPFPLQEYVSSSSDPKSPLNERRPSSDPINVSHSSVLSGSYIGEIARSLGHYDDDSEFLSFTRIRHSSSLPNIPNQDQYIEMTRRPSSNANGKNEPKLKPIPMRQISNCSPEMMHMFSDSGRVDLPNDSEESATLTDDSCSQNGDFNFPPLEEVKTSSPLCNIDCKPVSVKADVAGNTAVVRPVARETTQVSPSKLQSQVNKPSSSQSPGKTVQSDSNRTAQTVFQSNPNTAQNQSSFRPYLASAMNSAQNKYRDSTDTHGQDSFTDSLASNISFPLPQEVTVTTLPVSSSAVDMIVILQRLVGIGKGLSQTLAPFRQDNDSDNLLSSGNQDAGQVRSYSKCRYKLYKSFIRTVCDTICLYADNMMAMDLCGNTQSTACKLAGPRLVEFLQTQQKSGLIWGCRHDLDGSKNCFLYLHKHSNLLCDRHEPITREMCMRMNNVSAMLTYLDWFHRRLGNMLGIISDWSLRQRRGSLQMSIDSANVRSQDFIVLEHYGYDPTPDRSEIMETASQISPSVRGGGEGNNQVTSPIDGDRDHLMALLRAQSRIMAYRLNLFVADALPVLLTLKGPDVPIGAGLQPITEFLSSYIVALKGWLYHDSYRRVLECLWIFIVQDFETECIKLERSETDTEVRGQLLLQALSHLLKFMNCQDERLRRDLLLSQADDVSFKLSLYAMPVPQLIAIYKGLMTDMLDTNVLSTDSRYVIAMQVRQRMIQDLQTYRKDFSGTDLVQWILNNQELVANFDPALLEGSLSFTQEVAFHIAQRFLDWGLIADIDWEHTKNRRSAEESLESYVFPDMTIFTQMSGQMERPISRVSDDSTPQATPRATPRPGLRASMRAKSSQRGRITATPAGIMDKSMSMYSSKSQWSSEGGRLQWSSDGGKSHIGGDGWSHSRHGKPTLSSEPSTESKNSLERTDHDAVETGATAAVTVKAINEIATETMTAAPATAINQLTTETMTTATTTVAPVNVTAAITTTAITTLAATATAATSAVTDTAAAIPSHIARYASNESTKSFDFKAAGSLDSVVTDPELDRELEHEMKAGYMDPHTYQRGSPFSMNSSLSCDSLGTYFSPSSDTFYFVQPHIGNDLETTLKDHELCLLVEKCFQKKITAEYIVRIIYSRRKNDSKARNFIRKAAPQLQEKLRYQTNEDVSACVSS